MLDHSARVASRLVVEGFSAGGLTVKLKFADFTLRSRQLSFAEPTCDTSSLHRAACRLLDRFDLPTHFRIRLTGVSVHGLTEGPPPRVLFDDGRERGRKLEEVAARIHGKFEDQSLTRATLLSRAKGLGRDSTRRR